MTPAAERTMLLDSLRAVIHFALAARDPHRRERLEYLADMLAALEGSTHEDIERDGAKVARAITWAAHLLPTEGKPC